MLRIRLLSVGNCPEWKGNGEVGAIVFAFLADSAVVCGCQMLSTGIGMWEELFYFL